MAPRGKKKLFVMVDSGTDVDFERMLDAVRLEQSVKFYNTVVETAFERCVHGFRSTELSEKERECIKNTAGKYLRHTGRVKGAIESIQASKQEELQKRMRAGADNPELRFPSI